MSSDDIKKISVKKNMIMNAILTLSQIIFPIITFPYVSRILLKEGTGRVDFVASVISYFAMFAQLGIPTYGIRACSKVRDDKEELSRTVHELLFINIVMCVLVYAAFFVAVFTVPRLREDIPLYMIMGTTIFLNAIGVEWLYRGLEKYQYITIRSLIFKAIGVAAMLLLINDVGDYVIYGAITIFATSASNILNFINLRKYVSFRPVGGYSIKRHMKMVLTFFAMSVATVIYTNLDKSMLGFMRDNGEVGLYGAAVKIKNILISLVTSISAVLLPRASYYVDKGLMDEFYRILRKAMHFMFILATPISIYFMIFGKEGMLLLSGDDFLGAVPATVIITPTVLLIGITNVIGIQMLVPLGREMHVLYSEIVGAVIDIVLNALFIPKFGAAGAAAGTLAAELGVLIFQLYISRDLKAELTKDVKLLRIVLISMIGIIITVWLKLITFSRVTEPDCFIKLAISAVIFFGFYLAAMLVTKEEMVLEITDQVLRKLHIRK